MAKRKAAAASSDEEDFEVENASESESDRPIQQARRSGKKAKKQPEADDESKEESKPAKKSRATKPSSIKKPKFGASADAESAEDVKAGVNESGEKYIDLGKKRRATVRQFKGATFLDIREFYGDESDLKPGKKGISLGREQWENLKKGSDAIDSFFAEIGK